MEKSSHFFFVIAVFSVILSAFNANPTETKSSSLYSYTLTQEDDQFLDRLERASILFFWEQADPTSGQIRDRAVVTGQDETRPVASIASTGFGLTALIIAHKRGYIDAKQVEDRIHNTLGFILDGSLDGTQGFYYHFIDIQTGKRVWNCELSTIDTAILINGVLTVKEYFKDINPHMSQMAQQIYDKANYSWFFDTKLGVISMGWTPENGFLTGEATWNRYCELLMLVLQGVGAKGSNSVPAQQAWTSFRRELLTYKGMSYITTNAPLFIHQFSHAWYDLRGRRDNYTDYYENSVNATKVHMQWSIDYLAPRFPGAYSEVQWGITASDSANGYTAWGGPSFAGGELENNIDGSIVPCAAAGSLPFLPKETLAVLKHINTTFPQVWDRYGFRDAFNPLTGWLNPDVIGIDLGVTVLMAENLRTGFVWDLFMKNEEVRRSLDLVGLKTNSSNCVVSQGLLTIFSLLSSIYFSFKLF